MGPSSALTVRALREGEGSTFLTVVNAAICGLAAAHYSPDAIDGWLVRIDEHTLAEWERNDDCEIRLVAELDGTPVGIGALVVERSELRACYVLPQAARRGVGTALVAEIERLARVHRLHRLELASSLNAEPFYTALGYSVRQRGEVTLANGHRMPCVWMEKKLIEK